MRAGTFRDDFGDRDLDGYLPLWWDLASAGGQLDTSPLYQLRPVAVRCCGRL